MCKKNLEEVKKILDDAGVPEDDQGRPMDIEERVRWLVIQLDKAVSDRDYYASVVASGGEEGF